jgi:hypothetical protein
MHVSSSEKENNLMFEAFSKSVQALGDVLFTSTILYGTKEHLESPHDTVSSLVCTHVNEAKCVEVPSLLMLNFHQNKMWQNTLMVSFGCINIFGDSAVSLYCTIFMH